MKDVKKLLAHRKTLKAKKPSFIRESFLKRKRLALKWRRPKGLHSKMRHGFKGHRKTIKVGYKSPVLVRGLTRSGLKIVYVSNIKELEKVDKGKECVIIKKTVGLKKMIELLKKAKELSLAVSNVKDIKEFLIKAEEMLKKKKEEKKKRLEEKKKKEKEKEKKKEEKKEKEKKKEETADELAERVKKEEEEQKKEKDKVLTKKA